MVFERHFYIKEKTARTVKSKFQIFKTKERVMLIFRCLRKKKAKSVKIQEVLKTNVYEFKGK